MKLFPDKLIIASNNQSKTDEWIKLLARFGICGIPYTDLIDKLAFNQEANNSYLENAIAKADFLFNYIKKPVVADDSGIELKAFPNRFGLNTSREVSTQSLTIAEYILKSYAEKQDCSHKAKLISAVAMRLDGKTLLTSIGIADGYIAADILAGNGYELDTIFIEKTTKQRLTALPNKIKDLVSHKGKALQGILNQIAQMESI